MSQTYSNRFSNFLPYGETGSAERSAYKKLAASLFEDFRKTLEHDFKTTNLPQRLRDKMFEMAWSKGHANGYDEVSFEYTDLAGVALAAFAAGVKKGKG